MKGNEQIIERLNARLADELTAVNQYIVHAEMCEDWGYGKLHDTIKARAIEEMKHAEELIARILFLEGKPAVSKLNPIHIGAKVDEQFRSDWEAENEAIKAYNEDIKFAMEIADGGTRELLEHILEDEEKHIDWIESQFDLIEQVGLKDYLVEQMS